MFILALSVFTGATALALEAAPDSLHYALPEWAVVVWGVLLVVGSCTTLVGMAFQSLNGIIIEQVGSVTVGVTAIFYAVIATFVSGADVLQGAGIIGAWGLACLVRWRQLQTLIENAHSRQIKQAILERVYAEIEERAAREVERARRRPGGAPRS